MSLRFVDGRPVSDITTQFLTWCCTTLETQGKRAWLLIWDNASWHGSKIVRTWIREHNQQVKASGKGVRILPLFLPTQSPWLNPIEPKWVHGKRAVVEPNGLLTAKQLIERICAYYHLLVKKHLNPMSSLLLLHQRISKVDNPQSIYNLARTAQLGVAQREAPCRFFYLYVSAIPKLPLAYSRPSRRRSPAGPFLQSVL